MAKAETWKHRAVVFDLDGTLIDSEPQCRAGINRVLAKCGRRPLGANEVAPLLGKGVEPMMRAAFAATGADPGRAAFAAAVKRYLGYYLEDPASHTVVYPGVPEVLGTLRDAGWRLGVCTNKPSATTVPVLRAVGLMDFFSAVVAADDVPMDQRKPNGAHIAITVERMGASLERTVYVGDSESDVRAARDAGVPCVLVSYGYGANDLSSSPDTVIDRFDALPGAIAGLSLLHDGL